VLSIRETQLISTHIKDQIINILTPTLLVYLWRLGRPTVIICGDPSTHTNHLTYQQGWRNKGTGGKLPHPRLRFCPNKKNCVLKDLQLKLVPSPRFSDLPPALYPATVKVKKNADLMSAFQNFIHVAH
jgi:hypothetical protein